MTALSTEHVDPRVAVYSACEREPIHIPGSIQPHGALLVVDAQTGEVLQASLNTRQYLGHEPGALLGKPVSSLIGEQASDYLRVASLTPAYPNLREPVAVSIQGEDMRSHESIMLAHDHDGVRVLEFEPVEPGQFATMGGYHRLIASLSRVSQSRSEAELLQRAVSEVQATINYGHVMYYQFEDDGTGVVTHESRANTGIRSYLGHHFPASDIPVQARELYRRHPLRFIFDTEAAPIPIRPEINPRTGRALDLSYAALRSIAPVHIAYLRNMGVRASLSLSIVVHGRLDGLIACHNSSARTVSDYQRTTCQGLAGVITAQLSNLRATSTGNWSNEVRKSLQPFISEVINGQRLATSFRHHADTVLSLLAADCVFLQLGDVHVAAPKSAEKLPFPVQLRDVGAGASVHASDRLGASRNLPDELREFVTGGLVIDLGSGDFLCVGRREYLKTMVWGGDPTAQVVHGDGESKRLSPRASFESWEETVRGRSRAFGARERAMAGTLRNLMMEAKALEFRRLAEERLQLEASTDSLTGLINRREFSRLGTIEVKRARRHDRELAVVYFDIDHFKAVNDTHGHEAGDLVLRQVAEQCLKRVRANDLCARLGGEEFVVLLTETGLPAAVRVAECLRQQFENCSVDYQGTEIRFTSSFGVAELDRSSGETLEDVLKRADEALYEAKESGRNRVVSG